MANQIFISIKILTWHFDKQIWFFFLLLKIIKVKLSEKQLAKAISVN